jgi:hypothetical protein
MDAWVSEDFDRAAASAPTALELLAKAALWNLNPVLLVPLEDKNEASLISLATTPALDSPTLRTIGLKIALGRLEKILGGLPVTGTRRERLNSCRNGALHVGTMPSSGKDSTELMARRVLSDSLTLCNLFGQQLGDLFDSTAFYGDKSDLAQSLLDEHRSEVQHKVTLRFAQARDRIEQWQRHVDDDEEWRESAGRLEINARHMVDPYDVRTETVATDQKCPVCGYKGLLIGRLDVDSDADAELEDGEYVYTGYWVLTLFPTAFACNVCKLRLDDLEQLKAAEVPASPQQVSEFDLGQDFSASEWTDAVNEVRVSDQ